MGLVPTGFSCRSSKSLINYWLKMRNLRSVVFGSGNQRIMNPSSVSQDLHVIVSRTYKVIPLSPKSGLLEWVSNTLPLSEYLVGPTKDGELNSSIVVPFD